VSAVSQAERGPLSDEEKAELSLLDHTDALKQVRRNSVGVQEILDEYGEEFTPSGIRFLQQKREFWQGQEDNYQRWYAPKQYGNVMSEFTGKIDVAASPEVCFSLWNDLSAVMTFVPGMEKAVRMADRDYVECVLFYQFADSRTHPVEELRFMAHIAEFEENRSIHYQSTDGFPCGVVVALEPGAEGAGSTSVSLEFYCHFPYDLARTEGVMKVAMDVEEKIADCLQSFAELALAATATHDLAANNERNTAPGASAEHAADAEVYAAAVAANDVLIIEAGLLPSGAGLVDADGREIERGEEMVVSSSALQAAAAEFEARVGRAPFMVELVKQLNKQ